MTTLQYSSEGKVSLIIHALQVTHHMKHDLKSTTFCHCFSPAELLDTLKFLMISRICNGRKRDSLLLLKIPGCSSRKKRSLNALHRFTRERLSCLQCWVCPFVEGRGAVVSRFFKFSHFCLQRTKYHFPDSLVSSSYIVFAYNEAL